MAFVDLEIDGNLKRPAVRGWMTLNNTKLMNFNLEERFASVDGLEVLHVSRDLAIAEWRSNVHVTPERVALTE